MCVIRCYPSRIGNRQKAGRIKKGVELRNMIGGRQVSASNAHTTTSTTGAGATVTADPLHVKGATPRSMWSQQQAPKQQQRAGAQATSPHSNGSANSNEGQSQTFRLFSAGSSVAGSKNNSDKSTNKIAPSLLPAQEEEVSASSRGGALTAVSTGDGLAEAAAEGTETDALVTRSAEEPI